ncbi:hypothetical protein [Streptomyces sp. NPDC059009]|uniref:hypothetical protein n=1 Tax=Streptomyces sp. NPDC059009 TaxID=3346694 RepID=UPI00368EE7DD
MSATPHQRAAGGVDLRLLRATVFAAVCVVLSAGGHVLASCAAVPLWTLGAGFLAVLVLVVPLTGRARSLPGIAAALAAGQLGLHALFGLGQHGAAMGSGAAGPGGDASSLVERAARFVCGAGTATISPVQAQRILAGAGLGPDGSGSGSAAGAGPGAMGGHVMGHAGQHAMGSGSAASSADAAMDAMGTMPGMSLLPSLPMLLAHVLAAVAAGWLLRRGDLALLRIVRLSAQGAQEVAQATLVRSLRAAFALVRSLRAGLPGTVAPGAVRAAAHAGPDLRGPRTTALKNTLIRRGPPAADAFALTA